MWVFTMTSVRQRLSAICALLRPRDQSLHLLRTRGITGLQGRLGGTTCHQHAPVRDPKATVMSSDPEMYQSSIGPKTCGVPCRTGIWVHRVEH